MSGRKLRRRSEDNIKGQSAKKRRLSLTKKDDDYVYSKEDDSISESTTSEFDDDAKTPHRTPKNPNTSTGKKDDQNLTRRRSSAGTALLSRSKVDSPIGVSSPSTPGERAKRVRKPVNRGEDFLYYDDKEEKGSLVVTPSGARVVGEKEKKELLEKELGKQTLKTPKSTPKRPTPRLRQTPRMTKQQQEDLKTAGEYSWVMTGPRPVVELEKLYPEDIEVMMAGFESEHPRVSKAKPKASPGKVRGRPKKDQSQPDPKTVRKQKVVRIIKDGKTTVIRPLQDGETAKRSPVGKPRAAAAQRAESKQATPKGGKAKEVKKQTPSTERAVTLPANKPQSTPGKKVAQVTPQQNQLKLQKLPEEIVKKGTVSPEKFILTRSPPGMKGKDSEKDQYVLCMNEDGQLMYLPADVVLSNTTGSVRAEVTVPHSTVAANKQHIVIGDASSVKVKVRKEELVTSGGSVKKIIKESIEEVTPLKGKSPTAAKYTTVTTRAPVEVSKTTPTTAKGKQKKAPQSKKQKSNLWNTDTELFAGASPVKTSGKDVKVVTQQEKAPTQDFVLCLNKDDGEFVYISRDLLKGCDNLQPVNSKQAVQAQKKPGIILKQKASTSKITLPPTKPVEEGAKVAEEELSEDDSSGEDSFVFPSPVKSDSDVEEPDFYICERTGELVYRNGQPPPAPPVEEPPQPVEKPVDVLIGDNTEIGKVAEQVKVTEEENVTEQKSETPQPVTTPPIEDKPDAAENMMEASVDPQPAENMATNEAQESQEEPQGNLREPEQPVAMETDKFDAVETPATDDLAIAHSAAAESLMSLQGSHDVAMETSTQNATETSPSVTCEALQPDQQTQQEQVMYQITHPDGTTTVTDTLPTDVISTGAPTPSTSQPSGVIYEITQPDGTTVYTDTLPPEMSGTMPGQPQQQVMYQITNPDGTITYSDTLPEGCQVSGDETGPQPAEVPPEEVMPEPEPRPEPEPELEDEPEPEVEPVPEVPQQPAQANPPTQKLMYEITQPDGTTYLTDTLPDGVTLIGEDGAPVQQQAPSVETPPPQPMTQDPPEMLTQGTNPSVPTKEQIVLQPLQKSFSKTPGTLKQKVSYTRPLGTVMSDEFNPSPSLKPLSQTQTPKPLSPAVSTTSTSTKQGAIILMRTTKGGQKILHLPPSVSKALTSAAGTSTKTVNMPSQKKTFTLISSGPKASSQVYTTSPSTSYKRSIEQSGAGESAFSILSSLGQSSPAQTTTSPSSSKTKYIVLQTSSGLVQVPVSGAIPQRKSTGGVSLLKKAYLEASGEKLSAPETQSETSSTLPIDLLQQAISTADIEEDPTKNVSTSLYQ